MICLCDRRKGGAMKLKCDLCGGPLQVTSGGKGASCMVCGLNYTMERLQELFAAATCKSFYMPIEEVFYIAGKGVVVVGKVEKGSIKVGDPVMVDGVICTVTEIESFLKILPEAQVGDQVGIALRGIERDQITKGDVLTAVSR